MCGGRWDGAQLLGLGPLWEAVPRKVSQGEQPAQQGSKNTAVLQQLEPVMGMEPTSRLYGLGLSLAKQQGKGLCGIRPGSSTCQVLRELQGHAGGNSSEV